MSKTKNTPEFLRMMEELQRLEDEQTIASDDYEEKEQLFDELAQETENQQDATTQLNNLFNQMNEDLKPK